MPLGMDVGLSPGDFVLDGEPVPTPRQGGGARKFLAHVYCGQTAGWIKMPLNMEVGLGLREAYLHTGLQGGGAVPLSRELGPHLVQCGLSRGLLPYQAASSYIQPFGHNRHGPKIWWEWVCPFFWGKLGPHRTQCRLRDVGL